MPKQENIFTISYALAGYSWQKLASQIANFKNEWYQNINKIIFSEVFNNFVNSLSTYGISNLDLNRPVHTNLI